MGEQYHDLGPLDDSIPTNIPGVNQTQLRNLIEDVLQHGGEMYRLVGREGTYEHAAYEASIGMIQSVHPNPLRRYLGWRKQRKWEGQLRILRSRDG